MEILLLIGTWCLNAYTEHNFIMKAISKLYKARTKYKGLFLKSSKKVKRRITPSVSSAVIKDAESVPNCSKEDSYIKISSYENIKILFTRVVCVCQSNVTKRKDKLYRLYDEGCDRIDKEFDIVNIVQNLMCIALSCTTPSVLCRVRLAQLRTHITDKSLCNW